MRASILLRLTAVAVLGIAAAQLARAEGPVRYDIRIEQKPLATALKDLAAQTGLQVLVFSQDAENKQSPAVQGKLTNEEALNQLLRDSGLTYERIDDKTVAIRPKGASATALKNGALQMASVAQTDAKPQSSSEEPQSEVEDTQAKGIPEILVKGKRSLNIDIQRTENDPQPYVVFGREEIERSQAVNLEDFLRTRLPMSASTTSVSQGFNSSDTRSTIDLRGLGPGQTLILVDGRRMPGVAISGSMQQPNINGIPLASIERIEVLAATAGGIYGGSATGGVVNIILRRDFRGIDVRGTYANTFDTDAGSARVDLNGGFSMGPRTQVTVAASRSEANNLLLGDRDFAAQARALQFKNNPASFLTATTPPLGATANIRSAGGNLSLKPAFGGGGTLISSVTGLPTNFTHLPLGYAGPASDGGAALRANAGRYNLDLSNDMAGNGRGILAAPAIESASLNVQHEFGKWLEAFVDVSHFGNIGRTYGTATPNSATLAATAPNNPFQQTINVRFPAPGLSYESYTESKTFRATGGLTARLPGNWAAQLDYGWSRSRYEGFFTGIALDSVGSCVLGRGQAANIDPDGAGAGTPCRNLNPANPTDTRPALNALQEGNTFPIDFTPYLLPAPNTFFESDMTMKNAMLRVAGPVATLPGGPLNLSARIERQRQELEPTVRQTADSTSGATVYNYFYGKSQAIDAYYLEARAPLVGKENARPFLRGLQLQTSIRHDRYQTRGITSAGFVIPSPDGPFPSAAYTVGRQRSTDYTLGLHYTPIQDVALRASFSTGFLPPSVLQIAPMSQLRTTSLGTLQDRKRGDTDPFVGAPFTYIVLGNPDIKPETSRSWSAGLILTPRFVPGLRLSVDYLRVDKTNEIINPTAQFILDNEDDLPGRIERGPNRVGDQIGWEGPITLIDTSVINIGKTQVEAFDIKTDYLLDTVDSGSFRIFAAVTWQPHYLNQLFPEAPTIERVGFSVGPLQYRPLEWRGNFGVNWDRGPLTLGWNAQFYDSYFAYTAVALPLTTADATSRALLVQNQGSPTIPSQMYHDLIATYRFGKIGGFAGAVLSDSQLSIGIQNVLDTSPPIVVNEMNGYSLYGDPRLRRYSVALRKNFGAR